MRYAPKHVLGAIKVDNGSYYGLIGQVADTFCFRSYGASHGTPVALQQQVGGSGWYRSPLIVDTAGHVAIGCVNALGYALAVKGTVHAQEVDVDQTNWSDFVFKPGYKVKTLAEVDTFIKQHKHLPDIPSDAEVKAKGVHVGDMQKRLLAKVEELTLYMIEMEKENETIKSDNQMMKAKIAALEKNAKQN